MASRLQCTSEHRRYSILNKSRINFDDVQRNLVLAREQLFERPFAWCRVLVSLGIETTTDVAKRAVVRDFAAIPALLILGILEVFRDCL